MSNNQEQNAMSSMDIANVIKGLDNIMSGSKSLLEKKDAMFVLMKLFETRDDRLLHMITELSKETLEAMNRHDTLIESLIDIGHLQDIDELEDTNYCGEIRHIKDEMHNSFALHSISKSRKSRNEVVSILAQAGEAGRTIAEKLAGKKT